MWNGLANGKKMALDGSWLVTHVADEGTPKCEQSLFVT